MRGWWALGLAVSLVAAPPDAEAKANRYLKRAKAAYENLDYTRVTPLLNRALKAATTAEDKIEIHYLMATMHTIYSRDRMAVEAFAQVLELDPAFELPPDTSPKIRTAFAAARDGPKPTPGAPGEEKGSPAEPSTTAHDGETPEATESQETEAALFGSADELPPLGSDRSEPWYSKWWVWAIVGAAAAGGTGYLIYAQNRAEYPAHTHGPVPLR